METTEFLAYIASLPDYQEQIAHIERLPYRPAEYARTDAPLLPRIDARLRKKRILPLYTHQANAINFSRQGKNIIVATPAASGKSLCYNLPVLEKLLSDPNARALYLYPAKALAQDQLRSLKSLAVPSLLADEEIAVYDGDTPGNSRADIRLKARIILSNPDMLHVSILPFHQKWGRFLRHLEYVVIDEAHIYRGVFGSHLANIIRRLRRLCRYYGSSPQFILSSATIASPGVHAQSLTGLPFSVVDNDGAPRSEKDFVFWNPPIIDPANGIRHSANSESSFLLSELVSHEIRTLDFARTKRLTELIYKYSRDRLIAIKPEFADLIKPYRGGYTAEDRRKIEKELFSGRLLGAVSTNALELGIDIGDLGATILTGFPGSISSTFQQAGRSGRRCGHSLSFLLGLDNPLDQYYMNNPEKLFNSGFEGTFINSENSYIYRVHLLCAAWEMPVNASETDMFGADLIEELDTLAQERVLNKRRDNYYLSADIYYPAGDISIRSASGKDFCLIDAESGQIIETLDFQTAFLQAYPGAVYLHQGESYLVSRFDLNSQIALLEKKKLDYYTVTRDLTEISIIEVLKNKLVGDISVYLGKVDVTLTITGYRRKAQFTEQVLSEEQLDLPPQTFPTIAVWFKLPSDIAASMEKTKMDFHGAIHAAEHALIGLLPLFALCDRGDIGGVSTPLHSDTGTPAIFIYDGHPGGVGIAEKGYEVINDLWKAARNVIEKCTCIDGCPSCVQSPKCGNNNKPLDKNGAKVVLERCLGKACL
ncbi:DEAD/DEAH box helicase [Dehalococcoides mccartyi]|uniref:ATP-dependent RNA helicase, DEAD/DEAH box family n=1 Tax=Dehalococcoides mccartyi (strain VS) TaxID=311424 RepID=D2BI18_DEHMV|nr:DEAD/DEAH box helicase [Dehalococcoides mccartyi]ACZ61968.1 ATP-dependent RNA helicase, DEAD/DEAH box family [Dehalococcoides mccartyi VS]